jgi:hypothetical protein
VGADGRRGRVRDFEDAFEGVFGDDPTTLYGQFTAELVADAVAVTAARPTSAGRPFAGVGWAVFGPDVAGGTFAYTRLDEHGRARIVVREVAVDDEAVAERAEDLAETLAADPDDVAPVPPPDGPPRRGRDPDAAAAGGARPPPDRRRHRGGSPWLVPGVRRSSPV